MSTDATQMGTKSVLGSGSRGHGRRTTLKARPRQRSVPIRASDLAKMTVCEQKLVYEKRYGEWLTRAEARRIRDGNQGHRLYLRQAFLLNPGVRSSETKPWCFIAGAVFGEAAAETAVLRALRDSVLRRYALGRTFMRLYYRLSPPFANYLVARPRLQGFVRNALKPAVAIVQWLLERPR